MSIVSLPTKPESLETTGRPRWLTGGRVTWSLLLIAAVAGVFVWGADRRAAISTHPVVLQGKAQPAQLPGPRFRVGSFNIRGGKSRQNVLDIQRTAATLRAANLDVIGLSEVHGYLWRSPRNQAADLAGQLHTGYVFAPTERRFWHDHFGNGLLTRVDLAPLQRFPLPCSQGYKYRNAVLTSFQVNGQTVNLLITHLDRVQDREVQLKQVIDLYLSLQPPAIMMGDFNTMIDDPQLQKLLARKDVTDAIAVGTGHAPGRRIDWIITRGLNIVSATESDDGTSDHPLIHAELELRQ